MGWTRRVGSGAAAAVMAGLLAGCDPAPSGWRSELVSVRADGTRSGDQASYAGVFSPDGTQVAFGSRATDLTGIADTNRCGFPVARPCTDVFVRDLPSGTTSLVSVNAAGSGTGDGPSSGPVFSPDGTKLAFVSTASNLGPTATTATCPGLLPTFPPTRCDDIYLRDLVTGTTSLVTTNAAGTDSANGNSTGPVFTPDGRALIFTSTASDLGPTDTNGAPDVYRRDLTTGATSLVSVNAAGTDAGNGASSLTSVPGSRRPMSDDGTRVAFESTASDLAATPDGNGVSDVYVRDLATGTTALASVAAGGARAADGPSTRPQFTADRDWLVFSSQAADLGVTDSNGEDDVFLRDLAAGTTTLVSPNASSTTTTGERGASLQAVGGTKVAFMTFGTDLGHDDANGGFDVYVRDLATATTTLVSANAAGTGTGDGYSYRPVFNPDATKVAFASLATDLGPRNSRPAANVYLRDLVLGTTALVSAAADGVESANGESAPVTFSSDGTRLLYNSMASNLGPTGDGGTQNVYVATLHGADLGLRLVGSRHRRTLTYELAVTNGGPDTADEVHVDLLLPDATGAVDVPAGCTSPAGAPPRLVSCDLGTLAPGDRASLTVRARATGAPGAPATAVARTVSATLDPEPANNVATTA